MHFTTAAGATRRYPELLLLPQHEALLEASGILPKVAALRGYRSADRKVMLRRLGFGPSQSAVPALVLPVWSAITGEVVFFQVRPDSPRVTADGRIVKYETPAKVTMSLDAHPFVRPHLGDPARPLWITEGVRKADAAVSRGLCCLALLGVWNWRGTNGAGGKVALPDWEVVALNGREVFVAFDSDVMRKPEVHAACDRLGRFLAARGAKVSFVYLPHDGAQKVGLDDFLAAGHSTADLLALAEPRLRRPDRPEAPAPEEVPDGAALLDRVAVFVRRFVVLTEPQAIAVPLWIAHTHAMDAADVTPFLAVTSPERRSGKTRLLEVLDLLVARPWRVALPSEAVLFRKVAQDMPTLLLDETDAVFKGRSEAYEGLRALLNAGNRRGVTVTRCVGEEHELQEFPVFCAHALAGIGALPDTVADRSIPIRLQRKAPHESIERFRFKSADAEAAPIREALEAWSVTHLDDLRAARPAVPPTLNDRAAEGWEPLLAIADLAGGFWPARARDEAIALHGDPLAEETVGVSLLQAIRETFGATGADHIATADLLAALVDRDNGPWAEWWGEAVKRDNVRGPAARLGRLLRPFGITSKSIRLDDGRTPKGYALTDFGEAFARYLPLDSARVPPPGVERRHNATTLDSKGPEGQNEDATNPPCGVIETARKPLQDNDCGVVASSNAPGGVRARVEGVEAPPDPLVADAVRRFGNPVVEVRSPDGSRRVVDDDEASAGLAADDGP